MHGRSVDAKYRHATAASVAASPSMLSSRLNALVIPTSQKSAITTPRASFAISSTREPCGDRDPGRGELRRELRERAQVPDVVDEPGDEEQRGSGEDPRELPRRLDGADERARAAAPAARPAAIPTPPNVGVARSCHRSPVGCATSRAAQRRRAEEGPEHDGRDGQRDDRDGCAHGSIRVAPAARRRVVRDSAPCSSRRAADAVPTIAAMQRLRRPAPLPRAVREPLPARSPREVQGLRARARVDARAPARADARLPRRLLGAVEAPRRRTSTTTGCSCSAGCRRGCSSRRRCRPARGAWSRTRR